jgi:hypothetical protein
MMLCAADYRAFPGAGTSYPKARLLDTALRASQTVGIDGDGAESRIEARAMAIAKALRSARWAGEDD